MAGEGDSREARGMFSPADSQAVWFFPSAERGIRLGLPNPADEVGPYNRNLKVRSRYRQGRLALLAGELGQAESAFKRALEQSWDHADSWLGLIETYERGRDRRLENVLREAHRSCPQDEQIALRLARWLNAAGREQEARQVLRGAFGREIDPEHIESLLESPPEPPR